MLFADKHSIGSPNVLYVKNDVPTRRINTVYCEWILWRGEKDRVSGRNQSKISRTSVRRSWNRSISISNDHKNDQQRSVLKNHENDQNKIESWSLKMASIGQRRSTGAANAPCRSTSRTGGTHLKITLSMRTGSALLRESEKNCENEVSALICLMYSIAGPGVLLTTIISLVWKFIEIQFDQIEDLQALSFRTIGGWWRFDANRSLSSVKCTRWAAGCTSMISLDSKRKRIEAVAKHVG